MKNAYKEFIDHVGNRGIKCCSISYTGVINLPIGYSLDQLVEFLQKLDFEYYDGHGGQELYGEIWYTDGTWSTRGVYDGSEWWEYHECPQTPEELGGKQ